MKLAVGAGRLYIYCHVGGSLGAVPWDRKAAGKSAGAARAAGASERAGVAPDLAQARAPAVLLRPAGLALFLLLGG